MFIIKTILNIIGQIVGILTVDLTWLFKDSILTDLFYV